MRILYAIQGTGNGHLSRAKDVIPALQKRAEVDILISGVQADIELPFPVKYRYAGMSFIFGKKGGLDWLATFRHLNFFRFFRDFLRCPVQDYDLVINDFEPVSAWASKWRGVRCISLSHQSALLSKSVPQPKYKNWLGRLILKHYAPSQEKFSFHFAAYNSQIFTPIIRSEIRNTQSTPGAHYTVYLPAYSDEKIIDILSQIGDVKWDVFSKHAPGSYQKDNVNIQPVNGNLFSSSMASASGVLCGAGFETPAEALFLKKKLLVVPMKAQYEQYYNAAGLREMGVPVIKKLDKKSIPHISKWIAEDKVIPIDFPDQTQQIVDALLKI